MRSFSVTEGRTDKEILGVGWVKALVVLDYKLRIDGRTVADVELKRGREALVPHSSIFCCTKLIIKTH